MSRQESVETARLYIRKAETLLVDAGYIQLHGYNEINVLLRLAEIHMTLANHHDRRTKAS